MVNILIFLVDNVDISGPINATAPNPVTNAVFSSCFAKALQRPGLLPMPAAVMKLLLGEASELLLEGQLVVPGKLRDHDFRFLWPQLDDALKDIVDS